MIYFTACHFYRMFSSNNWKFISIAYCCSCSAPIFSIVKKNQIFIILA